jgi:Rrf2 family protein
MRITHKVDYGVRVMTALGQAAAVDRGALVTREVLATQAGLPHGFLNDILRILRVAGLVRSHRGPEGGWSLAKPAEDITVADIIRALEGPLSSVRGVRPNELASVGLSEPLISLWVAVRVALRSVLEHVTVADLAAGSLPDEIRAMVQDPDAWSVH